MSITSHRIELVTQGHTDAQDITKEVLHLVQTSGLDEGIVTLFCPSSTSALTTIEFEDGCLQDLTRLFDEIADPTRNYAHNARWGDGNGHSHMRSALLGPSLTVPFLSGKLTLGIWQQIIFVDFDNRPRQRELVVQIIGK
jgi:secondary thiamine-phosphate synthase enzyme